MTKININIFLCIKSFHIFEKSYITFHIKYLYGELPQLSVRMHTCTKITTTRLWDFSQRAFPSIIPFPPPLCPLPIIPSGTLNPFILFFFFAGELFNMWLHHRQTEILCLCLLFYLWKQENSIAGNQLVM